MSERNDGLRSFLQKPWVYSAFQKAVSGKKAKSWLVENHWRIEPGMTVLDVGCGPATMRPELPDDIDYYGFDPNPDYIATAERDYSDTFHVGVMADFIDTHGDTLTGKVDVVLCAGVLHHLTTEQMEEVLVGARQLLKPGGRFAAVEPARLARQDRWSRWVLNRDRGTNILHDFEWREAMDSIFPKVEVKILTSLIRIPYVHTLLTGWTT